MTDHTTSSSPKVQYVEGIHLTADLYGVHPAHLSDVQGCSQFLTQLPEQLGLTKLAPPTLHLIDSMQPNMPPGVTGFILLGESHISIHTWPEYGYVSIDVYSCSRFDTTHATNHLLQQWNPSGRTRILVFERG